MTSSKKHITSFKPSARLLTILGEQLLTDPVLGLLELVKNGHDADATTVTIQAKRVRESNGEIVVDDDGFGMDLDDVRNRFLVPATGGKARQKQARTRTLKGRLPLGEKGIGRFATQALASDLELVTRKAGHEEVVVRLDWDKFDSDESLHEIEVEISERQPKVFPGEWTGTRLTMRRLRQRWTQVEVERLQRDLRRLKSPFPKFGLTAFDIRLSCPEFPAYEDLEGFDLDLLCHYRFKASVDEKGQITYEYVCQHPSDSLTAYLLSHAGSVGLDLEPVSLWEQEGGVAPRCGPFTMTLFVFDRERRYLKCPKKVAGVNADFDGAALDEICGVSVFRDDMRVLPYGEPGNDWLHLDQDRINNPSGQIGNKQVVGYIELSQEGNPNLHEKADRYGLQENAAFRDLRRAVRAAIDRFREHWSDDRPRVGHGSARIAELKSTLGVTLIKKHFSVSETSRKSSSSAAATISPKPKRPAQVDEFEETEPDAVGEVPVAESRASGATHTGGNVSSTATDNPHSPTGAGPAGAMGSPAASKPMTTVKVPETDVGEKSVSTVGTAEPTGLLPAVLACVSRAASELKDGTNATRWPGVLEEVAAIGHATRSVDVGETLDHIKEIMLAAWARQHIHLTVSGGGFTALATAGHVALAVLTGLMAAEVEVLRRRAGERNVSIFLNAMSGEIRISWVPGTNRAGSAFQDSACRLVELSEQVLSDCSGRVEVIPQDYVVVLTLLRA